MPGFVPTDKPLPIDPDWTVDVRCPHGTLVRGDLDLVRSNQPLVDPCPQAVSAREQLARAEDLRRMRSWWYKRKARRWLRRASSKDFS